MVEQMLADYGYEVRTASDGKEAREILCSWKPDLVLSDVNMPGVNGLQLLRIVKESLGQVPMILMSGDNDVQVREEALAKGANAFLLKPFSKKQLRELVAKLLA